MDQRRLYSPEVEAAPADRRRAYEDDLVRYAVTQASERAMELAGRLRVAKVSSEQIQGVDDLARIPVLSKDRLPTLQAETPPFGGMVTVESADLRRIFMSPGPIFEPEADRSDFWRWSPALWACGFRPGDIVYNTFAYHLTPAGAMMEEGLRSIGCTVVPGGVGNTELQAAFLSTVAATGYVGTPEFLLTLLEQAKLRGMAVSLQRGFVAGAPLSSSLRSKLRMEHGLAVLQGYGTADAGCLAYECENADGWHVAPGVVIEIVDPVTGQPVSNGETGEVVVTSANDVYPLVRFGTGDLSAYSEGDCTCGRTSRRLVGFLGRVGDGVKVRGMFVHASQLSRVLSTVQGISRFQAIVSRENHRDEITLRVEVTVDAPDEEAIADLVRSAIKVRARVVVVPAGTLGEDAMPLLDSRTWD